MLTLIETDPESIGRLAPALVEGTLPQDEAGILLTSGTAQRLGARPGDRIQLLDGPSTGWSSTTTGSVAAGTAGTARGYRLDGITAGSGEGAWALPAWLAPAAAEHPQGVSRHFLVDGAAVSWQDVRELNALMVGATSREVLTHYPPADQLTPAPIDPRRAALAAATLLTAAVLTSALVIMLVTPAFLAGADRRRRITALAVAAGAPPRAMATALRLQGALLGLVGALLGTAAGLAAIPLLRALIPDLARSGLGTVPAWALGLIPPGGALLGLLGTALAARDADSTDVVRALTGRPAPPEAHPGRTSRALARLVAALALALGAGGLSLVLGGGSAVLMLIVFLLAALGAALLAAPLLLALAERIASRLPIGVRSAVRDARRHGSRTLPALGTVMVCSLIIGASAVLTGSTLANVRDLEARMAAEGRAVLGTHVPVDDAVDRAVLTSVVAHLRDDGLVTGSHPVLATASDTPFLEPVPAPGTECPADELPSVATATEPGAPPQCVAAEDGWSATLTFPSWISDRVLIMDPEGLLATGLPGVTEAARVLGDGGAVVAYARALRPDGSIEVATRHWTADGDEATDATILLPGAHVRGLGTSIIVSPATAAQLGLRTRYVGEVLDVSPSAPAGAIAADVSRISELAWANAPDRTAWWSGGGLFAGLITAGLGILCLIAVLLGAALGRAESHRELAILHAIGASPRVLRLRGLSESLTVLILGLVPGLMAGAGLGVLQVLWMRRYGGAGPYRLIAVEWPLPALVLGVLVLLIAVLVLPISRPPRDLIPRRE